jgi:hypothetical protein
MDGHAIFSHILATPKKFRVVFLSILAFTASLSSALAWKVSDVDFATKIGSEWLSEVYIATALVLLISSSCILYGLKWLSPQAIFLGVHKYATIGFGLVTCGEVFLSLSHYSGAVFAFKVIGYAYSCLVINSFWLALNPYAKDSTVTVGQCTLYTFCNYFGMAIAGMLLQSNNLGAGQLGLLVSCCSVICSVVGHLAFCEEAPALQHLDHIPPRSFPVHTLFRAMIGSSAVLTLVVGSILLNVLVSSTEYYVIADFESRVMKFDNAPQSLQSFGSFLTLIGLGNIVALFTARMWSRCHIGRAGLPVATILAVMMMRVGMTGNHSLMSSVLTLLVVESLYPLVVESNLEYLLNRFLEHEQPCVRTMIDTVAEPAGLILSAILLFTPWFDIHALGIGVVCVAFLLLLFSYCADAVWRKAQFAFYRRACTIIVTQASALLVLWQTLLPCIEQSYDVPDDLSCISGADCLYLSAIQWCD